VSDPKRTRVVIPVRSGEAVAREVRAERRIAKGPMRVILGVPEGESAIPIEGKEADDER